LDCKVVFTFVEDTLLFNDMKAAIGLPRSVNEL